MVHLTHGVILKQACLRPYGSHTHVTVGGCAVLTLFLRVKIWWSKICFAQKVKNPCHCMSLLLSRDLVKCLALSKACVSNGERQGSRE